jgi:hypothetical protein
LAIITMKFNWDKEVEFYIDDWCCTASTWIHMIFYSQVLRNLFAGWKGSESRGQMVKTQANGMIAAQTDALVVMLIIKYKL